MVISHTCGCKSVTIAKAREGTSRRITDALKVKINDLMK